MTRATLLMLAMAIVMSLDLIGYWIFDIPLLTMTERMVAAFVAAWCGDQA